MRMHLGLAFLVGSATAPVWADTPADTPPSIEKLIAQLGDGNFKVREAATKALAERAEKALPIMRKAQPHPDAETRTRLTKLIADADRAVLLSPKRVSLKLEQVPVKEALAALAKESGYRLELQGSSQQSVSIDVTNVTFWEAFDQLCVAGGLVLQQHYDNTNGLTVYSQNSFAPHVDHRGPFRLSAVSFNYSKSLQFASLPRNQLAPGQRSESLTFMFSIVAEPRLPLLGLGTPKLTYAVDDNGSNLLPPALGREYQTSYGGFYGSYRNQMLQTQVQLGGHGGSASGVRILRGTVPITFLAEQRPEIVIEKIADVKKQKFEGKDVTLEIDEVKITNGKQHQILMTARRGGKDTNNYDYTWTNSLYQRIEVTDEKGQKFQSHGFNWNTGTPSSVTGTYMFGDGGNAGMGKPFKLTYYGWITQQYPVEFEFKELPLP
ncbi:MAG: HEAT repeat domain-containing protein [Gemmataceae bacterium]